MKKAFFLLIPLALGLNCAVAIAQVQSESEAVNLLNLSYAVNVQLKDSEQLYYLTDLVRVSAELSPHPSQIEKWCNNLFVIASQMQDPIIRAAGEKNALMYLSSVQPVLAI